MITAKALFVSIGSDSFDELQCYRDELAVGAVTIKPLAPLGVERFRHDHRSFRRHLERLRHRLLSAAQS